MTAAASTSSRPIFNDCRLLLMTGKGGVGKTTVSLATAQASALEGKKVLLILLAPTPWGAQLFRQSEFSYSPTPVSANLDIAYIDPRNAFREYIVDYMHVNRVAAMALNRPIVTHFLDAIPGLNELLILGKIYSLVQESLSRSGGPGSPYDFMVVDAPATGHGVSLLQVPLVVRNAIKVGPLKTQAEKIVALFSKPEIARLSIVTLLEDMPVQETIDLADRMEASFYMTLGPIFANAALPALPPFKGTLPSHPAFEAAHFYEDRLAIQHHYRQVLEKRFDTLIELPFLAMPELDLKALQMLGQRILH